MFLKISALCVVLFGCCCASNIPEYIHICKRTDPNVAKCVRESVEVLKPKLKSGIPEIGVPSLEPLLIPEIVISPGNDAQNLKAILRNVEVSNLSNFKLTKLKLDVNKLTFRIGVKFPTMMLDGDYDVDVKVLVAPIKGTGRFHANITNCEAQGVLKAEIVQEGGHKLINFTSFNIAIRFDDYNLHLDNLFSGDEILSRAANEILNSNKAEFIPTAIPFIQKKASEIILEIANKITKNLDLDDVFPEK